MVVPVEPISLTIGAVALASLFSLCVQCFDLIEIGKNLGADREILVVKLSIEKRRLMVWGEAVGILRTDTTRDALLDDSETKALVERILENVKKLFTEAEILKLKYGLEPVLDNGSSSVEGSAVCSASFGNSPIVQFQTRLLQHLAKAKHLKAKTKWAIRDFKKFGAMVQNLKELLDGLSQVTTAARTTILKSQLIRQETEAIPDLRTLKMIESTCSEVEWRSSASAASEYIGFQDRLTMERREDIQQWMSMDGASSTTQVQQHHWSDQEHDYQFHNGADGSLYDVSGQTLDQQQYVQEPQPPRRQIKAQVRFPPRLPLMNHPQEYKSTKILVVCSTSTLVAWVGDTKIARSFSPIERAPRTTVANRITATRLMKAMAIPTYGSPCIIIYCPPRMRYVHLALAMVDLYGGPTSILQFQIRFDDRLLDQYTVFSRVLERMIAYHTDIELALENSESLTPNQQRISAAIDMHWLEQRIDALPSTYTRPQDEAQTNTPPKLDWHTIFRQSKDDHNCLGIIILAGEANCWEMLNTKPVLPPDTFREGRVYRLRELDGADAESDHRWKADMFCQVAVDKDFDAVSDITQPI